MNRTFLSLIYFFLTHMPYSLPLLQLSVQPFCFEVGIAGQPTICPHCWISQQHAHLSSSVSHISLSAGYLTYCHFAGECQGHSGSNSLFRLIILFVGISLVVSI